MKKTWGLQNSRSRMIALFIVDILSVILDSYLAIILRFKLDNIWVPAEYMYSVESYMVINVITTVVIFLVLNLYNRVWSYASMNEMLAILGATMLSTVFQNFSSGMQARLGFAIATMVRPDILVVDEILSVGDYQFQQKCYERMGQMLSGGTTLLYVSHDINSVRQLCDHAIWIDKGNVRMSGLVEEVTTEYMHMNQ